MDYHRIGQHFRRQSATLSGKGYGRCALLGGHPQNLLRTQCPSVMARRAHFLQHVGGMIDPCIVDPQAGEDVRCKDKIRIKRPAFLAQVG